MADATKTRWPWKLWMVLAVSLLSVPGGVHATGPPEGEVIATLDDKPITLSEIEENAAFQIYRLRAGIHSLLEREVMEIVNRRLLAQEAAREGMNVEALLQREVDGKVVPLTKENLDAYLAEHPEQAEKGPEGRARLRTYLEQRALMQRRLDFLAALLQKADFKLLTKPPERPRIRVDIEGAPSQGSAQAPVTLVHFAHYSSRLCAESAEKIRRIMEEFPGQIRWVHRNFLSIQDPDVLHAAETAEAAFRQGKFWEYHDAIFAHQGNTPEAAIREAAREAGLDMRQFDGEQKKGTYLLRVKDDIGYGVRIGVQAPPVIFVNGIYFSGTFPFEELKALVRKEMEKAQKNEEEKKSGDVR